MTVELLKQCNYQLLERIVRFQARDTAVRSCRSPERPQQSFLPNVSTTGHERDGHRSQTPPRFVAGPASVAKPDHRGRIWLAPKGPRGHCSGRAPSKPSPVIRFWRETVVPSRISWGSPRTLPDLPRSGLLSLTFGGDAGHERGRTARGSYGGSVRPGPPATTGGPMG